MEKESDIVAKVNHFILKKMQKYECLKCNLSCISFEQLEAHNLVHHSRSHYCNKCNKNLMSKSEFLKHTMNHYKTSIYQCKKCKVTYKKLNTLKNHIRYKHLGIERIREQCSLCFKNVLNMKEHLEIHEGGKFVCKYCNKRFIKYTYYKTHLNAHYNIKIINCDICNKAFPNTSALKCHKEIHEKWKDDEGNYLVISRVGRLRKLKDIIIDDNDVLLTPNGFSKWVFIDMHCKWLKVENNSKKIGTDVDISYLQDYLT